MSVAIIPPTDPNTIQVLTQSLIRHVFDEKKRPIKTLNGILKDHNGNWRIPVAFAHVALKIPLPDYTTLPRVPIACNTVLGHGGRDYQIPAYSVITKMLVETHFAFLSLQCGGGKTEVAVKIIADLGLKTAVVTDVSAIFPQWVSVLKERTNARVCEIKSAKDVDPVKGLPEADVYVFMITAVGRIHPDCFNQIKFLVVDEATYLMTPEKMWPLLHIQPAYTLGCCAEIKRDDKMHVMVPTFFGEGMYRRISDKPYLVHKVNTPYKPNIKNQRYRHGPDWNEVLRSLAENEERNEDIVYLCRSLPESKIVVGCKRKAQANYLASKLKELGESVETLIGKDNKVNNCRILVGIYSKMGRGIDIKNLSPDWEGDVFDTAIVAADITKPEQFVGRVFRHDNPVVYHFVDDNQTLNKHFNKECVPWYKSRKALIDEMIIDRKGEGVSKKESEEKKIMEGIKTRMIKMKK